MKLYSSGLADRVETSAVYSTCLFSYLILIPQPVHQVSRVNYYRFEVNY
jgi:hypothetical protein